LASLVIVVAGMLALAGVRQWNRQPVLAFALVSTSPNVVVVEIESTSINERYRIVATSKTLGANQYFSSPLIIRSGGDGTRVFERVPINVAGVWIIDLKSASTGSTLRWLKVDVH
jgi:hypothetical protein